MSTAAAPVSPFAHVPDPRGRFGPYGGRFVPETLMFALEQLDAAYRAAQADPDFRAEFARLLNEYVGRPSRLYFAERLTREAGGARIYLKREDLNHTGAHKINNALGQAMLAKRMGKSRVIAETGAGHARRRHGDRGRAFWTDLPRVHGRGGRAAAGIERLPHARHGNRSLPGRKRQQNAQGRHQRGHARVDEHGRRDPLHYRVGGWPPSLPHDGPRFPERHRRGDQEAMPGTVGAAAGTSCWPVSAGAATRPGCSTRSWTMRTSNSSAWRQAAAGTPSATMPRR